MKQRFNRTIVLLIILMSTFIMVLSSCAKNNDKKLPRTEASDNFKNAMTEYLKAIEENKLDLHSVMVIKDGNVIVEHYLGEGQANKPHVMWSVSKTFTATAVGFAVTEGKLRLDDRVISFFPDKLPSAISDNLKNMKIRDLLTMTCGHDKDHTRLINDPRNNPKSHPEQAKHFDWVETFLSLPVEHKPGTFFIYNTFGTYMLSAIVQKVTGEKIVDYLTPRLFDPLDIETPKWLESPQGINTGGWGLYLKTEDMAKMGILFLNEGKYNGKQIMPAQWSKEASSKQVSSVPGNYKIPKEKEEKELAENDWFQGYCFQMWRGRHNTYRADGMKGQFIIVIPDRNAVVVTTANANKMKELMNMIWDYILPAL